MIMKAKVYSPEHTWFTSDTHFWHTNIMKYCNRPFSSVEEMNETIINNWNSVVGKDDDVFHLGDFAFCGSDKLKDIIDRLNGHIHLIIGNHDWKMLSDKQFSRFESVNQQMYIMVGNQRLYLNHFPYLCYAGSYRKNNYIIQCFGHVHSRPETYEDLDSSRLSMLLPTQYDVGVDNNNFTPVSFIQLKQKIDEQLKKARDDGDERYL